VKVKTTLDLYSPINDHCIPAGTEYELGEKHHVTSDNEPRWMLLGDPIIPHAREEWFEQVQQVQS